MTQYLTIYRDGTLFDTRCKSHKDCKGTINRFQNCGLTIVQYDANKEIFYCSENNIVFDIGDLQRGAFYEWVLTQFKAEYYPKKLTKLLNKVCKVS